jgi:hypothetical protein
VAYEIWNEPDISDASGKMFFTGGPSAYERLYARAAAGVRRGDGDALVGGPGLAFGWSIGYLKPILKQPIDFASIHGYDNYVAQIEAMRAALRDRPEVPIFLTEYGSFTAPVQAADRHPAAMRFFKDVKGLLTFTDTPKVYWAQWVDDLGSLMTRDGHRKALFNAFKVYGMMPVDRNAVRPDGSPGVNLLASSDDHNAAAVLWNESAGDRRVTVHLNRLPLPSGSLELYRIDREHASYADNPRSEDLAVLERTRFRGSRASWSGTIPALGLIFLRLHDASRESLLGPARIGTFVRSHYGFPDRRKDAYADFDPRTSIARLGMGGSATAVAQIGNVMDDVERRLLVRVKRAGPFQALDVNSAFGLRIDFRSASGKYTKSVIFHGGLYDPRRTSALPWGKGGQADRAIQRAEMNGGQPFRIDLGELAPPDWDRHRVLITFLLQNAGKGSRARIALTRAALR